MSLTCVFGDRPLVFQLQDAQISAHLCGPFVEVRQRLTFQTPVPHAIEGQFEVLIPAGATVHAFGCDSPTGFVWASIVQKVF